MDARMRARLIYNWAITTFGIIAADKHERTARFLEEAIELAQALGFPKEDAINILDVVYSKKAGSWPQEIGQAQLTLECLAENEMYSAGEMADVEFDRIQKIPREKWIERQNAKAKTGIGSEVIDWIEYDRTTAIDEKEYLDSLIRY